MPQPFRIKHKKYLVEYALDGAGDGDIEDADTVVWELRIITADVLEAEQHGPTYGIVDPHRQSIAINTMWLWAAARRTGRVPKATGWPDFRARCVDWTQAGEEPVPPTQPPASTESSSDSPPEALEASTSTDGVEQLATTNGS